MSLSKTHYPLLVQPRKTHSNMNEKLLTGTLRIKTKIKIRIDILSILMFCKGYEQMTKVASSKERVNILTSIGCNIRNTIPPSSRTCSCGGIF